MGSEPRITYFEIGPEPNHWLELLKELFERHWSEIIFGPGLHGASFEIKMDREPEVTYQNGFLTVMWTRGAHFHLTLSGRDQEKSAARAAFFEMEGSCVPKSWGLRFWNGKGEELLSIYFPNPHLNAEGKVSSSPDWSKLKLWEEFRSRYAAVPK